MNQKRVEATVVEILKRGRRFLLLTHKDPDGDAIGSTLAMAHALEEAGKECVLIADGPAPVPYDALPGAEKIVSARKELWDQSVEADYEAVLVLDCADTKRLDPFSETFSHIRPWINIDHHETNTFFGDLNLVEPGASSTAELVYKIIKRGGLPLTLEVAENIFVAIEADTGFFRYENTTPLAFKIAAEMVEQGVNPWQVNLKVMDVYDIPRLRLLSKALNTIELHLGGRVAMMTLTCNVFQELGAEREDSERFVDYARFIRGVEVAAFVREIDNGGYKFSLRSNNCVNVAEIASRFGGGGHARAAGFERSGHLERIKEEFIKEVAKVLNGKGC